jgi:hypothetical protein
MHAPNHHPRPILVAVVHELLRVESFETITDLAAAVKVRAARLRLHYDSGAVSRAIAHVESVSKVPILRPARVTMPTSPSLAPEGPRLDAMRVLALVTERLGAALAPREMPPAAPVPSSGSTRYGAETDTRRQIDEWRKGGER